MTLNFPSGRSRSIPLRLFWRAPRISTQPRSGGAVTHVFSAVVEPTGDYPIARTRSQIFDVENTVFCSRRPVGGARASVGNSRASHSEAATENASRLFLARPANVRACRA